MCQNFLVNNFKEGFSLFVLCTFLTLTGCGSGSNTNSSNISTLNDQKQDVVTLGDSVKDANAKVIDLENNTTLYKTTTDTNGSFQVDIKNDVNDTTWLKFIVSSGVVINSNAGNISQSLNGKLLLFCKAKDLRNDSVNINIFTTIAATFYENSSKTQSREDFLNHFAKTVFRKSLDRYPGIDYRDLYAYKPNHTPNSPLKRADLYQRMLDEKVMETILQNRDLYTLLHEDMDADTLDLWKEILSGSSDQSVDTDGDGIDDNVEVQEGLNPASKDSDHDGIEDNNEKLYGTSALNSDTDGDYLPDNTEILNGTDPLNADEDGNGIVDGLDGDPFFKYQWYIKSIGNIVANTAKKATIIGNDLNILDVYHQVLGDSHNSIVQVVDTGVELKHEDLSVYLADSFNAVTKGRDPTATQTVSKNDPTSPLDSGHGTAVAGIIAAKTNNGLGIRGIVPRAKIAGSNWLENQDLGELERVWYSGITDDSITVSNNSWGTYYLKDESFERILALATAQLRNGKGRIYVFAAGNDREDYGNSNLSYLTNNPYVLTVASLNAEDKYASYSNPGSNILVSAYGGEHYYTGPTIMTTSLTNDSYYESELQGEKGVITVDEDDTKSYTYAMNGTSAAAPMVSGSIALVMDACPSLSWRDVRWLVANNAKLVDKFNSSWIRNAAGLHFSNDYGFGKINPMGMIDMCRAATFRSLPPMLHSSVTKSYNLQIPDNNTTIIQNLTLSEEMVIEWVGLTIDTTHTFSGDLEINLVSPSGTKVNLIKPNEVHFAGYSGGFRLSSIAFMDEMSAGIWHVEITDRLADDTGILKSLKLEVYGHEK